MNEHAGHKPSPSVKPDSSTKKTPEKPAQPGPHAGHDMGKPNTPGTTPKGPAGK